MKVGGGNGKDRQIEIEKGGPEERKRGDDRPTHRERIRTRSAKQSESQRRRWRDPPRFQGRQIEARPFPNKRILHTNSLPGFGAVQPSIPADTLPPDAEPLRVNSAILRRETMNKAWHSLAMLTSFYAFAPCQRACKSGTLLRRAVLGSQAT